MHIFIIRGLFSFIHTNFARPKTAANEACCFGLNVKTPGLRPDLYRRFMFNSCLILQLDVFWMFSAFIVFFFSLQTLQNRALRSIKHFPLKTSTKQINDFFKTDLVRTRSLKLAKKFAAARISHPQLQADYLNFIATRTPSNHTRFETIFDILT